MPFAKTKSQRRETIRYKRKRAPKGATLSGQITRQRTTRLYRGFAKKMIKKI